MLKMKSTMKKRYISDLLQQFLKNGFKIIKRFQPQATQQKYSVVEIYMVIKRCENTIQYTIHIPHSVAHSGKSLWKNKN